jgi:hypothetical protein
MRPATALGFSSPQPLHRSPLSNIKSPLTHYYGEDPANVSQKINFILKFFFFYLIVLLFYKSYIRSRPIEKTKDPKPILSQTGSPIMPGGTPVLTSHSSIKRYRPASTAPIFSNKLPTTQFSAPQPSSHQQQHHHVFAPSPLLINTNSTPTPFDKRMVNQIQNSLHNSTSRNHHHHHQQQQQQQPHHHYQPLLPSVSQLSHPSSNPLWRDTLRPTGVDLFDIAESPASSSHFKPQPTTTSTFQVGSSSFSKLAPQGNHHHHHSNSITLTPNSPKSPKIVNLQYNSPIGLYSNSNIKEELSKQIG